MHAHDGIVRTFLHSSSYLTLGIAESLLRIIERREIIWRIGVLRVLRDSCSVGIFRCFELLQQVIRNAQPVENSGIPFGGWNLFECVDRIGILLLIVFFVACGSLAENVGVDEQKQS